jgi:transposase-like protein
MAVAAAHGVHPNSVSRWVTAAKTPGGLDAVPPPPADDFAATAKKVYLKVPETNSTADNWPKSDLEKFRDKILVFRPLNYV